MFALDFSFVFLEDFSIQTQVTGHASQPCAIQALWSYWQLHNTPIFFSMGQNTTQVHQLSKDNAKTRINPLTLDYSLRLKCKVFTYQVAHWAKRTEKGPQESEPREMSSTEERASPQPASGLSVVLSATAMVAKTG